MSSVQSVDVPVERAPQVRRGSVLRRVERDPEDLGVLALAEHLDASQPLAERHLGRVVEVEVAEDEHAVGVERLQRGLGEGGVVEEPSRVDTHHLGANRGGELLERDRRHGSSWLIMGRVPALPQGIKLVLSGDLGYMTEMILLVDYAIMARRDLGMSRVEALVDACHRRARPDARAV